MIRLAKILIASLSLCAIVIFLRPLTPLAILALFLIPAAYPKDAKVHRTIDGAAGVAGAFGLLALAVSATFMVYTRQFADALALERWSEVLLAMNMWPAKIDHRVVRVLQSDVTLVKTAAGIIEFQGNKRIIYSTYLTMYAALFSSIPLVSSLWLRCRILFRFFDQQAGNDNFRHVLLMLAAMSLTAGLMLLYQPTLVNSPIQQFSKNVLIGTFIGVWIVIAMLYSAFVIVRTHSKIE